MSDEQGNQQQEQQSPLQTERGRTNVEDSVVAKIAGMTAGQVSGVHMGGGASRTAGNVLERVGRAAGGFGSQGGDQTRGVSAEVGQVEAAIDLKMAVEYGHNLLQTTERVRRDVIESVESLTGLRVTELNIEVEDVLFPEGGGREQGRRGGSRDELESGEPESGSEDETQASVWRGGGLEETGGREIGEVEVRERVRTEGRSGPLPEEEVRVEGVPVEEGETAELRPGEGRDGVEKHPSGEGEGRARGRSSGEREGAEEGDREGTQPRQGRRPGSRREDRPDERS